MKTQATTEPNIASNHRVRKFLPPNALRDRNIFPIALRKVFLRDVSGGRGTGGVVVAPDGVGTSADVGVAARPTFSKK